jgi:type II secretory pathway pseudopilin PulG
MNSKRRTGLTLIEIMIAASLLAIGIVGLVAALYTSTATISVSQELSLGNRAATLSLEAMRGQKDFYNLYNNYKNYKYTNDTTAGPFFINSDGSIQWSTGGNTPSSPPSTAIGFGYFEFVTNENGGYSTKEWGTATSWATGASTDSDGDGSVDGFDLDGNGFATNVAVTLGRTSETNTSFGYYVVLPVKVVIKIYLDKQTNNRLEVIRRAWLVNNYENN